MRADQSTTTPIKPKSAHGLTTSNKPYSIEGHISNGSHPNTKTPYISTTTDKSKALQRAIDDGGLKVVEIDITQIQDYSKLFDLSNETVRDNLLKGNTAKNFAKASSEFLIVIEEIPESAYKVITE